jgi:hypothetical protein
MNTASGVDSIFVHVDNWIIEVNSLNEKMKSCEINQEDNGQLRF